MAKGMLIVTMLEKIAGENCDFFVVKFACVLADFPLNFLCFREREYLMAGVEIVKVKDSDDGMRLNRWLLKYYPGLPLGRFQKLLRTKQIKVDGKKAESSLKLSVGQEIRVPPLDEEKQALEPKKDFVSAKDAAFIQSLVIYKDKNILVLNKPSGLAVQGGTNTTRHIDGMLEALKFDAPEKPKLVHRIDKDTSGLLVLARNRKYAELLTRAFREHQLKKTYLAFCLGVPKQNFGVIRSKLLKVGEKSVLSPEGKDAVTEYDVLDAVGDKFSLIEASPLTGRTHQIRVHLESIHCPIAGDDKYFGTVRQKFAFLADKLYLHAYKINLSPLYNKKLELKAGLPDYYKESLEAAGINFKE